MGEITVSTKGNEFALLIPQRQFNQLGLDPNSCYEIVRAREGIWVLTRKEKPKENPLDGRIFSLLKEKDLKDRVEKRFETFLGKEELEHFQEMLKEGKVVAFKLSPKYKRAVYKTREELEGNVKISQKEMAGENIGEKGVAAKKEGKEAAVKKEENGIAAKKEEKVPEGQSLKKNGFVVCKNANVAKRLSEQMRKDIQAGKIRGIKGFDGMFYIAEDKLYQKHRPKVLSAIKEEKGIGCAGIAKKLGIDATLITAICEFLKDEGEIIEKRKDQFQAI